MQFKIEDKCLQVSAESPTEALEIIKHFRLDLLAHTEALASGMLQHIAKPGARDNAEWFAVSCEIGPDFMVPYAKRLEHWTGYAGTIPEIEAPKYAGGYAVNLCHTHIVESARMSSAGFTFAGFIHSADWSGRTACDRAPVYFAECCRESIGARRSEPEFIEMNNGFMRRNPNYLKRHAPNPAASSALIFGALLQWWNDTHATTRQREILAQCLANHQTVCKRDTLGAFLLRSYENGFRLSWAGALVSLEEFKGA